MFVSNYSSSRNNQRNKRGRDQMTTLPASAFNSFELELLEQAALLGIISQAFLEEVRERQIALAPRPVAPPEGRPLPRHYDWAGALRIQRLELEAARRDVDEPDGKARLATAARAMRLLRDFGYDLTEPTPQKDTQAAVPKAAQSEAATEWICEAQEAMALVTELRELAQDVCKKDGNAGVVVNDRLTEADVLLCLRWGNVNPSPSRSASSQLDALRSYDQGRLLSARTAEKLAARYYEALGLKVDDVSITQLSAASEDWMDFDLLVDSRMVDVKNARESLHGGGHFVEHCVAEFKQHRQTGGGVRIAGVVSPYIRDAHPYFGRTLSATVLGEVGSNEVRALCDWATKRFQGRLEVTGLLKTGFLPGWLFEYPAEHYRSRTAAIACIDSVLSKLTDAWAYSMEIPGWMWVLTRADVPQGLPTAPLIEDLRNVRDTIGLSRRSLYVMALGLALESASGSDEESDLQHLLQTCRIGQTMLGLDDPLKYVESLVRALLEVVAAIRNQGMAIRAFRLTHPAILKATLTNGKSVTLLAYCGGWQSVPLLARCGKTPLTFSLHSSCETCGHLICDNCGYCADQCSDSKPRQAAVAGNPSPGAWDLEHDSPWKP